MSALMGAVNQPTAKHAYEVASAAAVLNTDGAARAMIIARLTASLDLVIVTKLHLRRRLSRIWRGVLTWMTFIDIDNVYTRSL
jgi:hypothetical protein